MDFESIYDWPTLSEHGLRSYAAQYVGWATNEMSDPDDLKWTFTGIYPLTKIALERDWETYWEEEILLNPRYDQDFINSKWHTPVVISIEEGETIIWDGWHRLASSIHRGDKTIIAIVGTKPEQLRALKPDRQKNNQLSDGMEKGSSMYSKKDQSNDLEFIERLRAQMEDLYKTLFQMNVGGRFHAFLEWCGVMNEHLNICEDMIRSGVPAFEMNRHTGNTPDIPGYRLTYMAEKMECIFDGLLEIKPANEKGDIPQPKDSRNDDKTAYRANDNLTDIPRFHQTQRALDDQLRDLSVIANRVGLYDAADHLRMQLERKQQRADT